jgi:hypothetical protein
LFPQQLSTGALPLAASIAAVSSTEAICERIFKAGGQVLKSAQLWLVRSRVESFLMTNYNAPQFGGIRGVDGVEAEAAAVGGANPHQVLGWGKVCGWDGVGGIRIGCAHTCAPNMRFWRTMCAEHETPRTPCLQGGTRRAGRQRKAACLHCSAFLLPSLPLSPLLPPSLPLLSPHSRSLSE